MGDIKQDHGVTPSPVTVWVANDTDKSFQRLKAFSDGSIAVSSSSVEANTVQSSTITVDDSGAAALAAANTNRSALSIANQGADTFYIGPSTVTAGDVGGSATAGRAVPAGSAIDIDGNDAKLAYYGIAATGGSTIAGVLQTVVV